MIYTLTYDVEDFWTRKREKALRKALASVESIKLEIQAETEDEAIALGEEIVQRIRFH